MFSGSTSRSCSVYYSGKITSAVLGIVSDWLTYVVSDTDSGWGTCLVWRKTSDCVIVWFEGHMLFELQVRLKVHAGLY